MSRRRALLILWLALLLASNLVRLRRPLPEPEGLQTAELRAVQGRERLDEPARLAWEERAGETAESPLVLMVHGSPGDHGAMSGLMRALPPRWRAVAPDMPGFGASARGVPDYSVRAYADYLLQLLDHLGVARAHLVTHSLGGGAALELWDQAPERVASITLIATIGAQEYELLGSYAANHAVHGLQLGLVQLGLWGLPHFGLLDDGPFSLAYARNFYDTDQRPLRPILERYDGPMLVLHGAHDFLVPVEAAREHARLVPQSELEIDPEGDHFDLFVQPERVAARVDAFLARVESGEARQRAEADPARVAASRLPIDPATLPRAQGPTLLVVGGLLAAATLVSEDLACITAGLMVSQGRLGYLAGTLACFLGIFIGDLGLLLAGRVFGRPLLRLPPLRWWVTEAQVDRASAWYNRNGPAVILSSRFMPGARLPLYVAAGILKTPVLRFAGWFALAGLLWTPLLVGGAALVGERVQALLDRTQLGLGLGLALAVALVITLRTFIPLFTWRGRRLALGWWRRQTRWEFWPMWRVYPPVVLEILRLGLRYRSLTVFTASNPGIPLGGLVGESKWDILQRLGGDREPRIPRTRLLPGDWSAERRVEAALAFQRELGRWPVVLKPDAGQRGLGVLVARSDEQVRAYLAGSALDTLIQGHVAGVEYGLFYVRRPGHARGELFSMTEKRPLDVTGDGVHTLEELILGDDRAVCMAPTHLRRHAERLGEVPAAGERVRLVEIGTHSQGSVFLDGSAVRTEALTEAVDALCQGFEGGFHFGRFDVRAESVDALMAGRFSILELNGVTSEAVHIYDPKNPLSYAIGVLREQWALAFAIGAANAAAGAPVASKREIVSAWWAFRQREAK